MAGRQKAPEIIRDKKTHYRELYRVIRRIYEADVGIDTGAAPTTSGKSGVPSGTKKLGQNQNIEMKFVWIAPGTFMMGSPSGESGRESDEDHHQVTISKGFELQTTEVTQAQWAAVMGNNPSNFKGANRPIENVSWNVVQEFIKIITFDMSQNRSEIIDQYLRLY
ncbi:MAG: hypothetical protein A2583_07900 [Bdellovibrionales bacterium RIFOXYD1_FULL_53_11]|nr:MAG: hypothetical protein A2583_07900 [Bdellovibrionales bacterium RIFOXYD1_FULL_53_11]